MEKKPLLALLEAYLYRYKDDTHALKTIAFLENNDDFWQNQNPNGHITASAWIIDTSKTKALLTHHTKLNMWFQLGGHVEADDEDIFAACWREATEESGLHNIQIIENQIFDIDVHLIPIAKTGFPAHFHYDIRVLMVADEAEKISFDTNESQNVEWFGFDTIKTRFKEVSIQRMLDKTQ